MNERAVGTRVFTHLERARPIILSWTPGHRWAVALQGLTVSIIAPVLFVSAVLP